MADLASDVPMYRSYCPIEACGWTHDDVSIVWHGEAERQEAIVRTHLETHTLLEWAQEVMRLRGRLAAKEGHRRRLADLKALVDELTADQPITGTERAEAASDWVPVCCATCGSLVGSMRPQFPMTTSITTPRCAECVRAGRFPDE